MTEKQLIEEYADVIPPRFAKALIAETKQMCADKACEVYEELMTCSGYYPEVITSELARMRSKLEE